MRNSGCRGVDSDIRTFGRSIIVFLFALLGVTGTAIAGDPPSADRQSVYARVAAAAESGSLDEFSATLDEAHRAIGDDATLQVFDDLGRVWRYRRTETISAFFDDDSSGGFFSHLVGRYSAYLSFIQRLAVRANFGRTLYPTAETEAFLRREAAARIAAAETTLQTATPAPPPAQPPVEVPAIQPPLVEKPPPPVTVTPPPPPIAPPMKEVNPPGPPSVIVPSTAPASDCASSTITALSPTTNGLLIRSTSAITATAMPGRQGAEDLPVAAAMLTVDIPNATIGGLPPRVEFAMGPFEFARIVRYRNETGCGIRLRLQPRFAANWFVVPNANGVALTSKRIDAAAAEGGEAGAEGHRPGLASVTASFSGSRQGGGNSSPSSGLISAAVAQALGDGPVVRGFVTRLTSRDRDSGSPFAGIGVSRMPILGATVDAAAGDIMVALGDTGSSELQPVTSSLFRGGGLTIRPRDDVAVQFFGGRAASASLIRVGLESTLRPFAHDRIAGMQVSWIPLDSGVAAAAGALHTRGPAGGIRTLNLFQAAEYRRSPLLRVRLVLEQSHAFDTDANGAAFTVDSYVTAERGTLSGYLRALSPHFRPAGGSGFYASLRRSYGILGTYRWDRLSAAASASQAKVFSILDAEDVGSLTTSRSVQLAYSLTPRTSLQAMYGDASIHTDARANIPADSETREAAVGVATGVGKVDASVQVARSITHNEQDPALDLVSERLDVSLRSGYWRDIYARGSIAHSERRDGSFAGEDYRATVGFPLFTTRNLSLFLEGGTSVTPAGVAQTSYRQTFVTLRASPNTPWFSGGVQITYERVTTPERKFGAVFGSVSTQKIIRWGEGKFFAPQLETRALRLNEPYPRVERTAVVDLMVFEDLNQNGRLDPGEGAITPASVSIGKRVYTTDASGHISARVKSGKTMVELLPRGAVFGYYVPSLMVPIDAEVDRRAEALFALRPAGRIAGRVKPRGEMDAKLLAGIYVHVSGSIDKDTVTDPDGSFDLGFLPEGDYRVSLVRTALSQVGLAAVEPLEASVHVTRNVRVEVTLEVRRATARERFGK